MFSHIFLAQTGQELVDTATKKTAYLSCHFSPYGKGLRNLPTTLPAGSLLILDDSMPPNGHDVQQITEQLQQTVRQFSVVGILLDFQGKKNAETEHIANEIIKALPCPVAVTEPYAKSLGCAVFLSPPPANTPLSTYLQPWRDRSIYLEIAPFQTEITVTTEGCFFRPLHRISHTLPFADHRLHCHYSISVFPEKAVFTVMRTGEDLSKLAKEAMQLGVSAVVGLYQELQQLQKQNPTG